MLEPLSNDKRGISTSPTLAESNDLIYNPDMKSFAFIDASNLFYGGEKSLGWKIDYEKLLGYLKEKYGVSKAFYFGGVEIHDFKYDYQADETVPLKKLEKHLSGLLKEKGDLL